MPADTRVLWRALQYAASCDVPVWLQPAEYHLSKEGIAHDSALASRLGLAAIPVAAETMGMQNALSLAWETGARVHFTQISSAEGVALLRAAQDDGCQSLATWRCMPCTCTNRILATLTH